MQFCKNFCINIKIKFDILKKCTKNLSSFISQNFREKNNRLYGLKTGRITESTTLLLIYLKHKSSVFFEGKKFGNGKFCKHVKLICKMEKSVIIN